MNPSSESASGNVGPCNPAVSKAGPIGLTYSLALALVPRVRVNAIAPAFATEMTDAIPTDLCEQFLARIPLGHAGWADQVGDVVHWLCSPASSYVTGEVLPICGQRSVGAP